MQEKSKEPEIRFAGFTGAWEQRKLNEIADVYDGVHQTPKYTSSGVRFLSVENIATLESEKYISEADFIRDFKIFPQKGDILMTRIGDIGTAKVIKSDEKYAFYVSLALLKPKHINSDFLCNSIASKNFQKGLKARSLLTAIPLKINKEEIGKVATSFPLNLSEQEKIGSFFNHIESLLTLHQRKYEKLLNIKKSMLEKMFPKEGEVVPEIRFKGFTGAWEQRKLGALLDEYKVSIPTPHDGYTRLGIRSHAKGTFHEYVPKGRELETKEMNKVAKDKLILNITFAWEHAVAITDEKDEGALVSHRFPQFTLHPEIIPNFLKYVILDESFRHHLYLASPGGAGRNRVLKISQMLEYAIKYPSTAEQLRISNLLDSINSLITLHQRKLEMLKNVKQAFLEKMFV